MASVSLIPRGLLGQLTYVNLTGFPPIITITAFEAEFYTVESAFSNVLVLFPPLPS